MAKKTYTVKTFTQTAVPRAARLRGVTAAVGRSSAVVSGSGADHSHPNQRFLETLGDDIAATEDGGAATRRINLSADGSAYIEYNPDTGCLVCNVPMASRGDIAAFNDGEVPDGGSSGGGSDYNRLDAWADYDSTKAGYVLSALLGIDLNTRTKANADAIASLTGSLAALASTAWVRTELSNYLKKMPELTETDSVTYGLTLESIDGSSPIKAIDLTTHPVPLATKADKATKATSADKAAEADHTANADKATSADKATALASKRKIYGQDFDGSGNVDGSLTLTGANNGAGLWGTSVDLQVVSTTSAGTLYKAGTKAWGQSTFKDGNTYWWVEDGDTKTHVATYTAGTNLLLLKAQARFNEGLILQEGEKIYLNHSKTAWMQYNSGTGCLVCNVPMASRGDIAAFNGGEVPDGGSSGGGSDYNRLDAWADYDSTKAGYVLSALLGIDLNTRTKANADAIASLTGSIAALASTAWVSTELSNYLKKMPELAEAQSPIFVLTLESIDGSSPIKAINLTTHPVPLATNADSATRATTAAEADHATNADHATAADKATNADHATAADKATNADHATKATSADKATALASKRKIYGQDFDGSGNVDGSLTLTGANNGAGLWGTSVDLQIVSTTSAGTLYKAGTKAWGQSTFKDGNTYWWVEDGDTKTHVASYTAETNLLLLKAQARFNEGLILQEGEKIYLTHNKTVWLRYDAARGVIVANKPIVTAGDVSAFDTQAE